MTSRIVVLLQASSMLRTRGLRYDPLRTINGALMTDLEGNVIYSLIATYRSVLTKDSFVTTTL